MEVSLKKSVKNVTIIHGFPGFGLVGTIATEFLVNHLDCKEIGSFGSKAVAPIVAVHNDRLMRPITLYYAEKPNILLVHAITPEQGQEWDIAQAIKELAQTTSAKKIISLEGVASKKAEEKVRYYAKEQVDGLEKLQDGIIAGVTAALLALDVDIIALFADTHSQMPDSRAAAKLVEILDKELNLAIDPKPLLKQAELFEAKIKKLLEQSEEAQKVQPRYIG